MLGSPRSYLLLMLMFAVVFIAAYVSVKNNLASANKTVALLQARLAVLERENKKLISSEGALSQKLVLVEGKECTAKNQPAFVDKTVPSGKNINPSLADSIVQDEAIGLQIKKSEKFNAWLESSIKNSSDFNIGDEMSRRFEAEKIDLTWSSQQENALFNLFTTEPSLSGFALKNARCRTSQCQISISVTDLEQANVLVGKVTEGLKAIYSQSMVVAVPDQKNNSTTLYISKSEHGFEFN